MKINQNLLLENTFKLDLLKNNKHTSITQVCLFTIKSLIPSSEIIGCRIDYKRFIEEVNLWRFYKEGNLINLENYFNKISAKEYYQRDRSFFIRAIPIISASQDYLVSEEEIVKNLLLTSASITDIFLWIVLNRITFLSKNDIEKEELLEKTKDYIINFSQKDFLEKYESLFRFGPETYGGNYTIDFEKNRILVLNALNNIKSEDYLPIYEIINMDKINLDIEQLSNEGYIYISSMNNLESVELNRFYYQMIDYVERLRNSRIDPESLKIKEYILPNVFMFNEREEFYHSLLNNSKVIKKETRDNTLISTIQTKTGKYVFKAKKAN